VAALGLAVILLSLMLVAARRRRAHLEAAIQERLLERDRLAALLARVNEGQSLPEVLDFLYDAFQGLVPCDRIGYATIEDDMVRAAWARTRFEPIQLGAGTEAPLKDTSLERLAREGGMRIIADLQEHLRRRPESEPTRLLVQEGMRSSLSVPLHAFGKPVGFLFFNSAQANAYTQDHAQLLQTVAAQLSVIIEKSRLMMELEEANAVLGQQATTDPLTGLANRRALKRYLELEWLRMRRSRQPLALLFLDLDHFKAYNDRYGHTEGDACLLRISGVLAESAQRPGDFAARWGGEEFVLVLSGTSLDDALAIAERLRKRIEAVGTPHEASPVAPHVTVSIGVAALTPAPDATVEELFKAADEALYRAKKTGRNRVETPGEG